jgi:hypothetical protein
LINAGFCVYKYNLLDFTNYFAFKDIFAALSSEMPTILQYLFAIMASSDDKTAITLECQ